MNQCDPIVLSKAMAFEANRKPRILFIGEAVSLAHIGRPSMLAHWAQDAGWDTHFACGEAYADVARAEGMDPIKLPTVAANVFNDRIQRGVFPYSEDDLYQYIDAERQLINRLKPDLVVGDFRLSLPISTALSGVPFLNLINAYWSPTAPCRFPAPSGGVLGAIPHPFRDMLFNLMRPIAFRSFARSLNRVRVRFGLAALKDFREHYTAGDWCGYLDVPDFVPQVEGQKGHFFLGPLSWSPRSAPTPYAGAFGQERPLIYVSAGSQGSLPSFQVLLDVLSGMDIDLVLSGIDLDKNEEVRGKLKKFEGRLLTLSLMDPKHILKKAALCICHGGSGSIYQSLEHGVPVLCLPTNSDQCLASAAQEKLELGMVVRSHQASHDRLERSIQKLLTDGAFQENAQAFKRTMAACPTRERWVAFLQSSYLSIDNKNQANQSRLDFNWSRNGQAKRSSRLSVGT